MEHKATGVSLLTAVIFTVGVMAAGLLVCGIYIVRALHRIEDKLQGKGRGTGEKVKIIPPRKNSKERRATHVQTGRLISYGVEPRVLIQGGENKTIRQFYVDLESRGRRERVWGMNLQDGLQATCAKNGDTIRVSRLGKRPGTRMNLYAIDVLDRVN